MSRFRRRPSDSGEAPSWTEKTALVKLLNRLSRSDLSSHEATNYLLRAGCPDDLAQRVVLLSAERGFLDDTRVAQSLQLKAERMGWSHRRLRQQEYVRGVQVEEPPDEEAACRELAARWLERGYPPDKVSARLQRRGFGYSVVAQVLRSFAP